MGNCLTTTRTGPVNVKPERVPELMSVRSLVSEVCTTLDPHREMDNQLEYIRLDFNAVQGSDEIHRTYSTSQREPMAGIGNGRRRIKLGDLPQDVLRRIFSKLPVEEVVRTSVLSRQWRFLWTGCPKLSFDSRAMCMRQEEEEQDTQMFIDHVNAILRQHSGKGVEELEVKCFVENKLVDHLDNWIRFAMFSRPKKVALDMRNAMYYIMPSELFDKESASCLRCLQVSFVRLKLPSQFLGFSNLRVLELYIFNAKRKDLEDLLCSCCNLEWLSMVNGYLRDELTVVRPLPRLQYLRIVYCTMTKIEFHVANLSTFVYRGLCIPIALHQASKLENAQVQFHNTCLQQAVTTVLLNGIPDVQRLTLNFALEQGKPQWMLGSTHMFSRLRHVQLLVRIYCRDNDKLLCLLSFLRVAPGIEKLEVHLEDTHLVWFAKRKSFKQEVPSCEYKHLKSVYVSGFLAGSDQVEFIMHLVENAPAIEVLVIDTDLRVSPFFQGMITPENRHAVLDTIRRPLRGKLLPSVKLLLR